MKKRYGVFAVIVLSVSLLISQGSFAQGRMDPEQRIQQMISSLEITSEQEPKFREVMNAYFEKVRESMTQGGGDREAMMATIQALQAEQEKNLSSILTDAQMAKYKEQQAERRARMGQ